MLICFSPGQDQGELSAAETERLQRAERKAKNKGRLKNSKLTTKALQLYMLYKARKWFNKYEVWQAW